MFHIASAIHAFPSLFEELFVASDKCCPDDVLSVLEYGSDAERDCRVAGFLKSALMTFDESGAV